jgi:bacterial leucyl aminopeptidase
MNTRTLLATLMAVSLLSPQALAQDAGEWIVMGSDAAGAVRSARAQELSADEPAPMFEMHADDSGLTVARIDDRMSEMVLDIMHRNFRRCGGYTVHPSLEEAMREKNNPVYRPGYKFPLGVFPQQLSEQAQVNQALPRISAARIVSTMQTLEGLGNRYFQSPQGVQAADRIEALWKEHGQGRTDFSVERVSHSWAQPSVIASIEGAEFPNEVIVIGGHLDSINGSNPDDAPGADDNASGIAVVSEVLKVLTETGFKPKRTIRFMAYAAEEVGLRGSGDIAARYQADGVTVNGVLQFDMTGFAGSERNMYFVTDYVNPNATDFLKRLIAEYNASGTHAITWGETQCGYACSDHASWTAKGYPAAFPFEAAFEDYNQAIHSGDDRVANLDHTGNHQALFAKLGVEFAIEMARTAGTAD